MCAVAKRENIFLTGLMGVGKSTVGEILSRALDFAFIDTDEMIVAREQMSINEIFAVKGEEHFRQAEAVLLTALVKRSRQVIASGGGMLANGSNMDLATQNGMVVWLTADVDILSARLAAATDRPLLADVDIKTRLRQLLHERAPVWQRADFVVDTTDQPAETIATTIAERFRQWLRE